MLQIGREVCERREAERRQREEEEEEGVRKGGAVGCCCLSADGDSLSFPQQSCSSFQKASVDFEGEQS